MGFAPIYICAIEYAFIVSWPFHEVEKLDLPTRFILCRVSACRSKYEAIVDDASPEEILAQVQDAARNAADELHARCVDLMNNHL